jgi:myo-inositol catabolism protein IolC
MNLGYDKQLDLVAFDHRASFSKGLFGASEPVPPAIAKQVSDAKAVIFEAFVQALARGAPPRQSGILVDEEYGAAVARDARRHGAILAMPVEKSGQREFTLEYGADFGRHIELFEPDFSKVLVRYNADGDRALNERQTKTLAMLSDWLHQHDRRFLFELLVPPTEEQLASSGGKDGFDRVLRAPLVVRAIRELQAGGVEPDIWKIEGLESASDCARVVAQARSSAARARVACIVLGRGAGLERVLAWLAIAAPVPGFVGFAVGRTLWQDALQKYVARSTSRAETARAIADRYLQLIDAYRTDSAHAGAEA